MTYMGQARPKITLPLTRLERWLNVVSLLVLIGPIIYLALKWPGLPTRIVTHFDGKGEPNGWGGKATLFILPAISAALYYGLSMLSKFPHVYNYLVPITEANAPNQYLHARKLIGWIKFELIVIFGYIEWATVRVAGDQESGLGIWLLPAILVVVF